MRASATSPSPRAFSRAIASVALSSAVPAPGDAPRAEVRLTLRNRRGLHARASNAFMETVGRFDARVWVQSHNDVCAERVEADSVMELLLLGAACGQDITVTAVGPESKEVVSALQKLVNGRFGEGE